MDNHERDRRDDWPEEDAPASGSGAPSEPTDPATGEAVEPAWSQPAAEEPSSSTAEIESWPSQDSTAADAAAERRETPSWPTEPPTAGSAPDELWPTTPPERGTEPIPEPGTADVDAAETQAGRPLDEPPPSEVEAYSSRAAAGPDASGGPAAAHSVPAAESSVGESTQCPRCGTENRPGLAFCRNCGQRLVAPGMASTVERPGAPEGTTACPRCGTHNRAGVAFCQNCGANLRGTAPGYVPPAVAAEGEAAPSTAARRGAVLGPVVLIIGLAGLATGYLLPFAYGAGSLFERALGANGYGAAFWSGYPEVGAALADQAYFGLAAPIPVLGLLIVALAIAGFARAVPGVLQTIGLVVALLWSVGIVVLFVVVELLGNWDGELVGLLRVLTPAGIIFFLASLIVLIGTLTRFGRS